MTNGIWTRRIFSRRGGGCDFAGVCGAETAAGGKLRAYAGLIRARDAGRTRGNLLIRIRHADRRSAGGRLVARTPNPSWIVIHPSKKYLYAINEVTTTRRKRLSERVCDDEASGDLTLINTMSSRRGPAHMSLTGRASLRWWLITRAEQLRAAIEADGRWAPRGCASRHDSLGKKLATDAPRGSFAISGHDKRMRT